MGLNSLERDCDYAYNRLSCLCDNFNLPKPWLKSYKNNEFGL